MDLGEEEDLPAEAREILDEAFEELDELEQTTQHKIEQIEARRQQEIQALRADLDEKKQRVQQAVIAELKPLQESYTRRGLLDEALAIREQIRMLKGKGQVLPAPTNLTQFGVADVGKSFVYDVVGASSGALWGSDVYTADSSLAVAAVHAGAVRVGERAKIRVTLVDTTSRSSFEGSIRNGVQSNAWGAYSLGYSVQLLRRG